METTSKPPPACSHERLTLYALLGLGVIGLSGLISGPAWGHSWYSAECCSDQDCVSIGSKAVIRSAPGGYAVTVPGRSEPVFFSHDKVKPSQDGEFHVCIGIQSGTPFCLYVPAGS